MILQGDARNLPLPDCSVDTICTDPPYELGFMGKRWDASGVAFDPATWAEVLRVAKPGAMLLAFGGRRTEHRVGCAIEDAGWEIVDKIAWMFGSGFPKSYNINTELTRVVPSSLRCVCAHHLMNTAADFQSGCLPDRDLYDEPPLCGPDTARGVPPLRADARARSRADLHSDDLCRGPEHSLDHSSICRLSTEDFSRLLKHLSKGCQSERNKLSYTLENMLRALLTEPHKTEHRKSDTLGSASGSVSSSACSSPPGGYVTSIYHRCKTCNGYLAIDGYGTALKPAIEEIYVARKPLDENYCVNFLQHGVAGLWIDGGRIGTGGGGTQCGNRDASGKCLGHPDRRGTAYGLTYHGSDYSAGRWPANLILDPEAAEALDRQSEGSMHGAGHARTGSKNPRLSVSNGTVGNAPKTKNTGTMHRFGDSGGASRYFKIVEPDTRFRYVAKPSRAERDAGLGGKRCTHPTVKPLALMRYLVRLTRTPTGGTVLDPFCGSGTTGMACVCEDRDFIGIDLNPEYVEIAKARIAHVEKHGPRWDVDQRQTSILEQGDLFEDGA